MLIYVAYNAIMEGVIATQISLGHAFKKLHFLLEQLLGPHRGELKALVLGCTHYPFMKKVMRQVLGDGVELLDGGEGTARETRRRLAEADLLNDGPGELIVENSSGDPEKIALTHRLLDSE